MTLWETHNTAKSIFVCLFVYLFILFNQRKSSLEVHIPRYVSRGHVVCTCNFQCRLIFSVCAWDVCKTLCNIFFFFKTNDLTFYSMFICFIQMLLVFFSCPLTSSFILIEFCWCDINSSLLFLTKIRLILYITYSRWKWYIIGKIRTFSFFAFVFLSVKDFCGTPLCPAIFYLHYETLYINIS